MRVHVTAEMIAAGVRGNCRACPVALALRAAGLTDDPFAVDQYTVTAAYPGKAARVWDAPDEVFEFITRFDAGLPVKPFSFDLA